MRETPDYIRVLVVSASSFIREGIISVLSSEDDIKVVGHASNRLELMECIYKLNPDVVIINDEDTDGISSLETIYLIKQKALDKKVLLMIKDYDEDKELAALRIGVAGFLIERAEKADFIRCIRAINRGEMWVRREIMKKFIQQLLFLISQREDYLSPSISLPSFTKRELEVMTLVSKGYKNKEIARRLFISEKTVKYYLSKIFKKLNIRKRTDIRYLV